MDLQGSAHIGDFHFSVSEPSPIHSEPSSQLHHDRRIFEYPHYNFDASVVIPSSEDGSVSNLAPQGSYHHGGSDVSLELDRDATLSTSPPGSAEGSCRMSNPSEDQWSQYRDLITRLYWEDNLPMPAVREHMSTEHGFFAT